MSDVVCDSDSEAGREPVRVTGTSSAPRGSYVVRGADDDGPPAKTKRSTVWDSFTVCATDSSRAICNLCKAKLSRGRNSKHYNTTTLHNHLFFVHKMKKPSGSGKPSTPSAGAAPQGAGVRKEPPASPAPGPALNAREKWPADHPRSRTISDQIGQMICTDLEPFSVVEKDGFRSLVTFLEPKYEIPPRSHFSGTVVPELYRVSRKQLAQSLAAAVGALVNITTDLWSSAHDARSYMCIRGHWCERVGGSVQKRTGLLSVAVLDIKHTAGNILGCLRAKLSEWEELVAQPITVGFVVSDGAAHMVRALREYAHLRCVSHTLHLVVSGSLEQDKTAASLLSRARSISASVNHSSEASDRLHDLQTRLGLRHNSLITDVRTRWNCSFYMIQRLVEQRRAVQILAQESDMGQSPTVLQPDEWRLAADMITVLDPFEEVTLALSKRSASISEVIPLLHGLCSVVRSLRGASCCEGEESGCIMADGGSQEDAATVGRRQNAPAESRELCAAAKKLAASLSKELENRFEPIFENATYLLATLLDPRYKTSCFPSTVDVETLKRTLVHRVEESSAQGGAPPAGGIEQTVTTPGTSRSSSVFSFLQRKKTAAPKRTQEPHGDVEVYLAEGDLDLADDPVKYWSAKLHCWPRLAQMALHHLSCPPSSVQSERVFSTAGNGFSAQRSNLDPEHVEQLVFIKVNEDLRNGIKLTACPGHTHFRSMPRPYEYGYTGNVND